jgi:4-amino-4-deoxy-L-arabinose transferase-like glycosyltransferase
MQKSQYVVFWAWLSTGILAAFFLFWNLGRDPLVAWDESRQAINALEMLQHKNPLITTFEGTTDLWNTKPSLLVAMQALSMYVMGINEFALRFPSALAAFLVCSLLFFQVYQQTQKSHLAFFAVLVLLSLPGFNGYHVSRTGDFDSLLTLFTTLQVFSFYRFLENGKQSSLSLFFLSWVGAVLTKGIAGLLFLPFFFLWLLLVGKLSKVFQNKMAWIGSLLSVLVIFTYYFYREHHTPLFILNVFSNEIGGRFAKVNMGHDGPWYFYLQNIFSTHAFPWIYLFLGLLLFHMFSRKSPNWNASFLPYILFCGIGFLILISLAKTKLPWYDAPFYPLFVMALTLLFDAFLKGLPLQRLRSLLVLAGVLFALFFSYRQTQKPLPTCVDCLESNQFGSLIKEGIQNKKDFSGFIWSTHFTYTPIPQFYVHKLRVENNQKMLQKDWKDWNSGEYGFLLQSNLLDSLRTLHPQVEVIATHWGIHEVYIPDLPNN